MMSYKELHIYVEGPDDSMFFEQIIKPLFETRHHYSFVKIITYSGKRKIDLATLLDNNRKRQHSCDYLFVCDMDAKNKKANNELERKDQARKENYKHLEDEKIIIVKEEIESWYLAGISSDNFEIFNIERFSDTEHIDKAQFKALMPKHFALKEDFMQAILDDYDLPNASTRNTSLHYFVTTYSLVQ
jgi:hypothetical protein